MKIIWCHGHRCIFPLIWSGFQKFDDLGQVKVTNNLLQECFFFNIFTTSLYYDPTVKSPTILIKLIVKMPLAQGCENEKAWGP
jgi:hypothetical protein